MLVVVAAIALAVLALVTQVGVYALDRAYPPQGKFVNVKGARLHIVELGPTYAPGLPIVLVHGASSSLEMMRRPLGDRLARDRRVILIDRPGHGWSTRDRLEDSTPAIHGRMIDEALGKLGIDRAIFVGHSWAGSLMPAMTLDTPGRVAGIVMLSPVAYPWPGGVGTFNKLATVPVIGPLLAYTIMLPLGMLLVDSGTRYVFAPQTMPDGYVDAAAVRTLLRPRVFLNNAWDLTTLKAEMVKQAPEYPSIEVPVTIVTGDADKTVSTNIHSRPFAAAVPQTKLVVLPDGGHMPQVYAADVVVSEIEAMVAKVQAMSSVAKGTAD
ncbi:alpha/beta hydrolase [Bradyrhizobium sp. G127]|uniref:alpha/beta fold hydrolase n=1 Tax=Bradyrhizobium sp. G127 TaxID=2904800 RepID=UPI001F269BF3|nr:alpha/beta hydrolase [Bradyrhizobium sp. G127]MCF2522072.1 alpha/beta hydrolase [Bradyrhizobium sp. G127]